MLKRKRSGIYTVLLLIVAVLVGLAGCSSGTESNSGTKASGEQTADTQKNNDKPAGKKEKFVFWDKSEFVADYNTMMKARVEQFGKDNNIEVEYVVVSPNDMVTKLMASIEGKNPPDLVMTQDNTAKQFAGMDQLVDVSDIYAKIDFTDAAKKMAFIQKGNYIVPQAMLAGAMYLRKDKWDEKGLKYPDTWEELVETAKVVNDPKNGFYATGFPIGASGGGDATTWLMCLIQGFGGIPIDKDNNITVNSPETLEALKIAASLYEQGLTPPSSVTWDDTGNNTAYLAGSVGIIFNSGSVQAAMAKDKPELLKNTIILPLPAGPKNRYNPGGANVFAIFKNGKNTEAAKQFVTEFFNNDFYNPLIEKLGGHWQPTIKGLEDTDFWKSPDHKGWLEASESSVPPTHPAESTEISMKTVSEQLVVKAVQKIVVNKMDPQKALDELEADYKRVFGK